jgi:hypothetical protein
MMHTNCRRVTLTKTTDALEQHLTIQGVDDFSVEELDEIIQILYNLNQANLEQRRQLFEILNPQSQFKLA